MPEPVCPYCGLPDVEDHIERSHGFTVKEHEENMRRSSETVRRRESGLLVVEPWEPGGYL